MQIFGRYRLLDRIAVGGMAEVFLARTSSIDGFDKDLIIKRVRPELSSDESFVSMFIDEARVSIALSHPNVVQVFDFGAVQTDDGRSYYLAMEFINGCDLGSLLLLPEFENGLPPQVALYAIGEVCRGLDYAHNLKNRRGEPLHIIHRDISPRNVLCSFDGGVKVADFGIAKAKNRISQTQPGMVLGKLVYMAPEHATGGRIDVRADVFSTGAVLWELLTGRQVYGGELTPEAINRIRAAEIDKPSTYAKNIGRKLDALVLKALAREPENRFQSAREMGRAISDLLATTYPKFTDYDMQSFLADRREELPKVDFDAFASEPGLIADDGQPVVLLDNEKKKTPEESQERKRRPTQPIESASHPWVQAGQSMVFPDSQAPEAQYTFSWSPAFIQAVEQFRLRPSIWALVQMADLCRAEEQIDAALVIYRIAALTFAQHGLLAQAMLCCRGALDTRNDAATRAMITLVPRCVNASAETMRHVVYATNGPIESLLNELLELAPVRIGRAEGATKLLTELSANGFVTLVEQCEMRRVGEGDLVVRQGDVGREMFLIANGRALVHATRPTGERVYIASLTSGDFFGENGFFTGSSRTASVEALYPMQVFVLTPELYAKAAAGNAKADETLLAFYKERVVDAMLATSPIFGLLPSEARREILNQFHLRSFTAGQMVIREGETTGDIYMVKSGTAEVFTGATSLSTLGAGALFGEVAALRGIPRTASVRAKTDLTTLVLSREDFMGVIDTRPDVKKKIQGVIAARVRENLDKLMAR